MIEPAGRNSGPSLLLVMICAALGYAVYLEGRDVPVLERIVFGGGDIEAARISPAVGPRPATKRAGRPAELELAPLEEFQEISARTLFNSTRRPIEVLAKPLPAVVISPSRYTVIGILISDGERMALIRRGAAGNYIRVRVGQEVDGWRVERILPDRVIIHKGGTKEELLLKDRIEPAPKAKRPRRKRGVRKPPVINPR